MPRCEFSEDQYEDFLVHELRYVYGGGELHYKPTRRQEPWLGYDVALRTFLPWFPPSTAGVCLRAGELTAHIPLKERWEMPVRVVNAFIQCKVPVRVMRRGPGNNTQWDRWSGSHYRIDLKPAQREALARTQRAAGDAAVVCYAAPCFVRHTDCDAFVPSQQVATSTHFQSALLLNQNGHDVYTYQEPDGIGWGFSEAEELARFRFFELVGAGLEASDVRSISDHVLKLWDIMQRAHEAIHPLHLDRAATDAANRILGGQTHAVVSPLTGGGEMVEIIARTLRLRRYVREVMGAVWVTFAL